MKELSSLIEQHPDFTKGLSTNMRIHEQSQAAVYTANDCIDGWKYNMYWIMYYTVYPHCDGSWSAQRVIERITGYGG